jgi:hypothetical protein
MKDVIGVFNPFGLVQKAGKRKSKTNKSKSKSKTNKSKRKSKTMRKKKCGLFNFI